MVQWLEVIKLRSAGKSPAVFQGLSLMTAQLDQDRPVEMKVYRHASLDDDLAVHLHWKTEVLEPNGSTLGLRLAQFLEEFGLIDHSIWIAEEK